MTLADKIDKIDSEIDEILLSMPVLVREKTEKIIGKIMDVLSDIAKEIEKNDAKTR